MKLLQSIPVKFASDNIAASNDFRNKWAGRAVAIAIIDIWHGSGAPQELFSETLRVVSEAPDEAEALIVFQDSDCSRECVRELLSSNPSTSVLYDCAGKFDSVFDCDAFEVIGTPEACSVRYNGKDEDIPQAIRDAFAQSLIRAADCDMIDALYPEDKISYWRFSSRMFGSSNMHSNFSIEMLSRYVQAISCGMCACPVHDGYGIESLPEDDGEMSAAVRKYLDATFRYSQKSKQARQVNASKEDFSFPVEDNVKRYLEDAKQCARHMSDIRKIWETALQGTPFGFKNEDDAKMEAIAQTDPSLMTGIAEVIGAKSMIDAYMAGVPIEDVLA